MYITAIVVTFNSSRYITNCLHDLFNNGIDEVIIIDNDSKDDTITKVNREQRDPLKKIMLIKNNNNVGFASAVNMGLKEIKKGHVLLINPDVRIPNNQIALLEKCMKKTEASIVGGKVLKFGKKNELHGTFVREPDICTLLFDYTNLRKLVPKDAFHKIHYYKDLKIDNLPVKVDAVSGAYMLFDIKTAKKVGFFDENFFMYLEDIDFCIRAKKKKMLTYFCPASAIYHVGGASSKNKDHINHAAWYKSRKEYSKKYFPRYYNALRIIFSVDKLLSEVKYQIYENLHR